MVQAQQAALMRAQEQQDQQKQQYSKSAATGTTSTPQQSSGYNQPQSYQQGVGFSLLKSYNLCLQAIIMQ